MQKIKIQKRVTVSGKKVFTRALPVEGKFVDFFGGKQIEVESKRFVIQDKTDELTIFRKKYPYGFPLSGDSAGKSANLQGVAYFLPYESAYKIWGGMVT